MSDIFWKIYIYIYKIYAKYILNIQLLKKYISYTLTYILHIHWNLGYICSRLYPLVFILHRSSSARIGHVTANPTYLN